MTNQPDLFSVENITLANKIDAFHSEDVQRKRGWQKDAVYKAIAELVSASDREISIRTGLSLTVVPDRRGKLLQEGLIEISCTGIDPVTNKRVTYYKLTTSNN